MKGTESRKVSDHNIPIKLLIAEDDADDRFLLRRAAESIEDPLELSFVKNGVELIDCLFHKSKYVKEKNNGQPDIILVDLNMPLKNGFEVLEEIKKDRTVSKIPLFIWSTSHNREYVMKAKALGAADFIEKPDAFKELIAIITHIIKHYCLSPTPDGGN